MQLPLGSIAAAAWPWIAALVAILGLVVAAVLRAPQLRALSSALGALRPDPNAPGEMSSAAATWIAAAGAQGAAALVGAATAVSLGGAGVLVWVWGIALVVAGLRYAEVALARTSPAGKSAGEPPGSIATRLAREGGGMRVLGIALAVLVALTALAWAGGAQGAALRDAALVLRPGTELGIVGGAAAAAAVLALLGVGRAGRLAGWLALAAMVVLVAVALGVASAEPGRAIGALSRAVVEAFGGAPSATPFSGATATEIALAALVFAIPPLVAPTGIAGALHATAKNAARKQAAAALLEPLVYALVTTLFVAAFVATGAYYRRVDTTRPLGELVVYGIGFETVSQRQEEDRLHTGYMRVLDGELRDSSLELATERGTVQSPRFEWNGAPADVALHVRDGRPFRLLRPIDGVIEEVPLAELDQLAVRGEMLPTGAALLGAALDRGPGADAARSATLVALLVLVLAGAAGLGVGASRSLPKGAPRWLAQVVAVLPAVGLGVAAAGVTPWLVAVGSLCAGASAVVAAIAIALRAREAR